MVQKIDAQYLEAIGGKALLDEQIALFQLALEEHSRTVNVPAPTAHQAVEQIVRHHGGRYEVVDPPPPSPETPPPPPPAPTIEDIKAHARERIEMVLSEHDQRNSLARMAFSRATEADRANWAEIERLQERCQGIKAEDPLPEDYRDDRHWVE